MFVDIIDLVFLILCALYVVIDFICAYVNAYKKGIERKRLREQRLLKIEEDIRYLKV